VKLGARHLTYCTNIHAGETWREVRSVVEERVVEVKRRLGVAGRFGVGLRLSAAAADELVGTPGELSRFRELLAREDLYVFTINGFPHGRFHGTRVKERVYLPDWLDDERVRYTDQLAAILAELLPDGVVGSISTVPGAFRPNIRDDEQRRAMAARMARAAATLRRLEDTTGKRIVLALEPEPACFLETVADAVDFFTRFVDERRHLGVCLDACHLAVEFEDPAAALQALGEADIVVGKIQLSAGLEADGAAGLEGFVDEVYLHQTVVRDEGGLTRFVDLPEALAANRRGTHRVHFHVPLHRASFGALRSTQGELTRLLALDLPTSNLEVETYTWDVLPREHREASVEAEIVRELAWVRERLS
jgi:sugar phosphate isomerase/epimerase